MKVAVFSTKPCDRTFFQAANARTGHELVFFEPRLTGQTCPLAVGAPAVCALVISDMSARALGANRKVAMGSTTLLGDKLPSPFPEFGKYLLAVDPVISIQFGDSLLDVVT